MTRWVAVFSAVAFVPPALAARTDDGPQSHSESEPLPSRPVEDLDAPTVAGVAPGCHNSYDEGCGPFRYDPRPPTGTPLEVTVRITPARPKVGDRVRFTVVAQDDATIDRQCVGGDYGDGAIDARTCAVPVCLELHGRWTPPAKEPDSARLTFTHTYQAAGTYQASFPFVSAEQCSNPYADRAVGTVTFTVGR